MLLISSSHYGSLLRRVIKYKIINDVINDTIQYDIDSNLRCFK